MSSRRVLKAAQAVREVVGMAIIADLKDPRIKDATVTMVEVSPDMRNAKVHVSVMGDEVKQNLCLKGLQSSAGYLQSKIGNRIDTRYTPRIQFVLDKGIKNAMTVARILEEVLPNEQAAAAADEDKNADSSVADASPSEHFADSGSDQTETASQDSDTN
jgi:ribosome-binding factor A